MYYRTFWSQPVSAYQYIIKKSAKILYKMKHKKISQLRYVSNDIYKAIR